MLYKIPVRDLPTWLENKPPWFSWLPVVDTPFLLREYDEQGFPASAIVRPVADLESHFRHLQIVLDENDRPTKTVAGNDLRPEGGGMTAVRFKDAQGHFPPPF